MDNELPLIEHISELRKRIIICLVCLGVGTAVIFPFSSYFLHILKIPAKGAIDKFVFFSPEESFLIYMRIGILGAFACSMPVIVYQIWAFIKPALDEKVSKFTSYFVISCSSAFILGGIFAYFVILPPGLKFLLNFAKDDLKPVISAGKYISFVTSLIFGCGLIFQIPIISFILTKLGIINAKILRKKYKYALIAAFILAAIITPTADAFNMLIMTLPILMLYEISIWVSRIAQKK